MVGGVYIRRQASECVLTKRIRKSIGYLVLEEEQRVSHRECGLDIGRKSKSSTRLS